MTPDEKREWHRAYMVQWRAKNPEKTKESGRLASAKIRKEDPERSRGTNRKSYHANPETRMLSSARARAKKAGVPFEITVDDIVIPDKCPVFGFELQNGVSRDTSPSIDRIRPELGYVKSNIQIISTRANRIKNNSTPEELRMLADYTAKLAN